MNVNDKTLNSARSVPEFPNHQALASQLLLVFGWCWWFAATRFKVVSSCARLQFGF